MGVGVGTKSVLADGCWRIGNLTSSSIMGKILFFVFLADYQIWQINKWRMNESGAVLLLLLC